MRRLTPAATLVTMLLAALAGIVDALAFSGLGGFFASFMSGNSTRFGVGLTHGWNGASAIAAALVLSFVAGAMFGTIAGAAAAERLGQARRAEAVMGLVTILLALGAALSTFAPLTLAMLLLAAAMGAQNGVVAPDGEVRVGLTYMTGTLVRIGQRLARRLMGERDAPGPRRDLLLWLGFVAGVTIGAVGWNWLGLAALWVVAALAALLTMLVAKVAWE
ncbi:YoaK family protein [uncultured Sphingomonas sp.]|uniref:YoaK family protein n=1 Tax=uncultured Sphingomonas sp. TaxID=158754 RepID=UPI0025DFD06F|nr:YoaK family protein [uncultured Sphingomonas sp.]